MNFFNIDKEKRYVIYGAGGNCRKIMKFLMNHQYTVSAILDRRAKDISEVESVGVYTLEDYARDDTEKNQCIIFVSIKNVFEHVRIVKELLMAGYENVIYKPYPVLQGEHGEKWDAINYAYELIVEKKELSEIKIEGLKIACSSNDSLMVYKDELYRETNQKGVMCWLPAELVCNYNREDAYGLMPMAAYYPLVDVYQYMLNVGMTREWDEIEEDFLLYSADWVARTQREFSDSLKRSMINSRINVFYEMQRKADYEKDFFVRNAVSVGRMDNMRFYLLTSGRNRVSFMIARGCRFIPVYMCATDYQAWMNYDVYEKFKEYLDVKKIDKLFTAVPHPMLISWSTETIDYVQLFCMSVIKIIYRYLHWRAAESKDGYFRVNIAKYNAAKENLKICTLMKDEGCIGRLLVMYGFHCQRIWLDETDRSISSYIDELLRVREMDQSLKENDISKIQQAQILILDSRSNLSVVSDFCGEMIFLLQWGDEKLAVEIIEKYFPKGEILCRTMWNGVKVSGWFFTKVSMEPSQTRFMRS